ncbi:MAG: NAD(P)/FAD-dependent oxidoreductase [Planctomycetota bacterium]|nr:NAD(P)/FAD-dependent oxidoreductase [Planctomycetota bacterium]
MSYEEVDIVIVGGGLVGTTLAIALAKQGIPTTVLERQTEVPELLRGELIMPSGVEVLDSLGFGEELRELCMETEGTVLHHAAFDRGRCKVDYSLAPAPLSVGENAWKPRGLCGWRKPLYELLQRKASGHSCVDFRFGFELVSLERALDRRFTLKSRDNSTIVAKLVIAADGVHSKTRRLMNFEPYEHKRETFVQGFVGKAQSYEEKHVHVGHHELGAVFVFPFPENHFRCTFEYHKDYRDELRSEDALANHLEILRSALPETWEKLGGTCIEPRTKLQTQPGQSMSFAGIVEDGFALVGDAAGCLDPFTGFGMSLGLNDARVLSETLVEAKGDWSASNLRAYERRRSMGLRSRREATEALSYLFLNKSEGFADGFASRLGMRWRDEEWILPMVAAQFAGYDAVIEPSFGMKNHFLGLL